MRKSLKFGGSQLEKMETKIFSLNPYNNYFKYFPFVNWVTLVIVCNLSESLAL